MSKAWIHNGAIVFRDDVPPEDAAELESMLRSGFNAGLEKGYKQGRDAVAASATGDCSSRLQDSELDALRVRVGVLEGALRHVADVLAPLDSKIDHALWSKSEEQMAADLTYMRRLFKDGRESIAAVLAGGEAGKEKP